MITNELNLPKPFVDAATSDHRYTVGRYSVTDVLGGTCEAILKRRHEDEIEDDVADRVWAIFGTAVHKVLEEAEATDTQLQEQWFKVRIDGLYEMSGIFDLYDDSTGTVTDWKTTSVWQVVFGDYERWRLQTLAYCWMLVTYGFNAHRGEVVAILRDHSMRKAKTDKDYPAHPVVRKSWDFTQDDLLQMERRIHRWFAEVQRQERLDDSDLEPCSPEQRWHKDDKWAVKRKGRKTALRVYDSQEEAEERVRIENGGKEGSCYVEFREGEDTKCQSYCSVAQWCPYGRKYFQDSEDSQTPSADNVL